MKIGIIGAGFPGLVAARELLTAGHEVTVIEKSRSMGGRLATWYMNDDQNIPVDYGISHLAPKSDRFSDFVGELEEKGIVKSWAESFALCDGGQTHGVNPNEEYGTYYAAPGGMYEIAKYLNRWCDIKQNARAGGLTYFGDDRTKKRAWMINLTDFSVIEADAVIIAVPAIEAYGLLQTVQDETPVRKIIRYIDEVRYWSTMVMGVSVAHEHEPDWRALRCNDESIQWISNETSKRPESTDQTVLSIYSSHKFAREYKEADSDKAKEALSRKAAAILDDWVHESQWNPLHYWRSFRAYEPMQNSFYEVEMDEAPLALIGDYMGGTDIESAYLSAKELTDSWINRFK